MSFTRKNPRGITGPFIAALENLNVGVWDWSPATDEVCWTLRVGEIYGMPTGFLPGSLAEVVDYIHPEDRAAWEEDVKSCLAGEKDHDCVFRIITGEGEVRWTHASGRIQRDKSGEIARIVGAVLDVTDQMRSEETVRLFFDQTINLHLEATLDGVIQHVNPGWSELLGYTSEMLIGRKVFEFIHPDDQAPTAAEITSLNQGQKVHCFENRYRASDGSYRLLEWSATASKDRGVLLGVARDVTDIRASDKRLREAAAVFSNTAEGVCITDSRSRILNVNAAFTKITGYSLTDVKGRTPAVLKSDRHDEAFYKDMWSDIHQNGFWCGEIWNRRQDGQIYPQALTISSVTDNAGKISGYIGVFRDISERKHSEDQLHHLAHHDPLTSLPNRALLRERLDQRLLQYQRLNMLFAVLFIDLDFFKTVNDSLGHDAGDALLKTVAERLLANVRADDTVARISGDEFIVVMGGFSTPEQIGVAVAHLEESFRSPVDISGSEIVVTASIGVAVYPDDGEDANTLIRNADAAMYRAKQRGRDVYQFYDAEMTRLASRLLLLENGLRRALVLDQLHLVYQPQVDLKTGQCVGVEALLRWSHPEHGVIRPDEFIPVAEKSGVIIEIGAWVLKEACAQAAEWLRAGLEFGHLAVNVAAQQLADDGFDDAVAAARDAVSLPASCLQLELTESSLMQDTDRSRKSLDSLRKPGISVAVDDFGTGYSSLAYLKLLPINLLKIDRSFIADIPADRDDKAIAETIVAMAEKLHIDVIAEGVETAEQVAFLIGCGCGKAQGYLFSQPLEASAMTAYLRGDTKQMPPP